MPCPWSHASSFCREGAGASAPSGSHHRLPAFVQTLLGRRIPGKDLVPGNFGVFRDSIFLSQMQFGNKSNKPVCPLP